MNRDNDRRSWAKFNAYGFVLAGLAILALTGLTHPGGTDMARLVGEVPAGQAWWTGGFVLGGLLLLAGFVLVDRIAESAGLIVLTASVIAQTAVAWALLGWSEFTLTRLIIVGIIGGCAWARISVLWSRDGLSVTIVPHGTRRGHRKAGQ